MKNSNSITESLIARAKASAGLEETIRLLGLLEVYEATFDRCLESRDSREEAAIFAHEVFLNVMKHWISK